MLNATYGLTDEHKLGARKLSGTDEGTERNVKKAETYFRTLPTTYPNFSHYDPALYLLTHPELLEVESAAVNNSLDRFEAAFERIQKYA